jgi:hypothetical protein
LIKNIDLKLNAFFGEVRDFIDLIERNLKKTAVLSQNKAKITVFFQTHCILKRNTTSGR